jgi:hypothetical protein
VELDGIPALPGRGARHTEELDDWCAQRPALRTSASPAPRAPRRPPASGPREGRPRTPRCGPGVKVGSDIFTVDHVH